MPPSHSNSRRTAVRNMFWSSASRTLMGVMAYTGVDGDTGAELESGICRGGLRGENAAEGLDAFGQPPQAVAAAVVLVRLAVVDDRYDDAAVSPFETDVAVRRLAVFDDVGGGLTDDPAAGRFNFRCERSVVIAEVQRDTRGVQGDTGAGELGIDGRLAVAADVVPHVAQGVQGQLPNHTDL